MIDVPGGPAGPRGGREAATAPLRALTVLLAAAAITAPAAACGGDSDGSRAGGSTSVSAGDTAASSGVETAATPATADSALEADPRPLRAFRFKIRNEGADTAVIVADAGAGERTLDTVPPADSGEVRVETRAPLLELRARSGPGGEVVARSRYDLERPAGDTLLEFPVRPGTAPPDSAGG